MNAAFRSRLGDYGSLSESDILGQLIAAAARLGFSTHQTKQTEAWQGEIRFLRGFVERAMRQLPASKNCICRVREAMPDLGDKDFCEHALGYSFPN